MPVLPIFPPSPPAPTPSTPLLPPTSLVTISEGIEDLELSLGSAAITGDIYSWVASDSTSIFSLSMGDRFLRRSSTLTGLLPDYYYFDAATRVLSVRLFSVTAPSLLLRFFRADWEAYGGITTNIITTWLPPLLSELGVSGEFTINRILEDCPKVSLKFVIPESQIEIYRTRFPSGYQSTPVVFDNINYFVERFSCTKLNKRKFSNAIAIIEIDLVGANQSLGDPSRNPLDFPFRQTKQEETGFTNRREQLQEEALIAGGFLFYTVNGEPEIRVLGEGDRYLLDNKDILSDAIIYNTPGMGAFFESIQLSKEYRNTKLTWRSRPRDFSGVTETVTRFEFENATSAADAINPFMAGLSGIIADPTKDLRNPESCFDNGGRTKKVRKIKELNGETLEITETTYGFVFTSRDTYEVQSYTRPGSSRPIYKPAFKRSLSPYSFWQIVEQTTQLYNYGVDNYLTAIVKRGYRRFRLKQESSELEQIKAWIKNINLSRTASGTMTISSADYAANFRKAQQLNKLIAEEKSYKFNRTQPISETTLYTLEYLRDYYEDIAEQEAEAEETDDSTAPPYVPPMFATKQRKLGFNNALNPNPADNPSDPETPQPASLHRLETIELINTNVLIPNERAKKPEKYKTSTFAFNAEGEGGKNRLEISGVTESSGRPPVQPRLPDEAEEFEEENEETLLNTPDSIPAETFDSGIRSRKPISEGTESFQTYERDEAIAAAKTRISLANTREACTVELVLKWQKDWEEGDVIDWEGKYWIVINIDARFKIDSVVGADGVRKSILTCEEYKVKLGRLLLIPVEIDTVDLDEFDGGSGGTTVGVPPPGIPLIF